MKNLKHISKRALALLLTLIMCLSMVNFTAFAAEDTESTEDTQIVEGIEGTGDNVETGTDGEDKTGTDGEDKTGTDGEDKTGTDGEDKTGTDGEDKAGTDGEDKAGTDGEDKAGTDGEDKAGTDGEDKTGTDGEDKTGTDGEDKTGTDGEDKTGTDGEDKTGTDGDTEDGTDAEGETQDDIEENEGPEAVQAFLTAMDTIADLQESDADPEDVLAAVEAAEAAYDALSDAQKADETVAGMYEALVAFKEAMPLDETPAEPKSVASLDQLIQACTQEDGVYKLNSDVIVNVTGSPVDAYGQIPVEDDFNLDLNGHTITYAGPLNGAIFRIDGGATVTIDDTAGNGTLQGNLNDNTGSLIKVINGTLNLNGGTVTGHRTTNGGCTVYVANGGTFNMSDNAIISGSGEGAGNMVITEGTFNMSGGKITGGVSTRKVGKENNKWNPIRTVGGGVCVLGGTFTMTGGTISKNKAEAGGGIYVEDGATLNIYGGSISKNEATGVEYAETHGPGNMGGGGIWINGTAVIDPLYDPNKPTNEILIQDNTSRAKRDLGGGGIYVNSNTGSLSLKNAVITGNHAYGLGGGLASCVDGSVMLVDVNGAAIFSNISDKNVAQIKTAGDTPTDGHLAWGKDAEFMNDATDVLCASREIFGGNYHGALISNKRFDGQEHNWVGWSYESDGTPVEGHTGFNDAPVRISAEEKNNGVIYGSYALGLRALNTADVNYSGGKVIISGNYSDSHGGGIACNGVLNLGFVPEHTVKAVSGILELNIAKEVKDESGKDTQMVGKDGFKFQLLDENLAPVKVPETGDVVTGTTDANGKAVISYKDLVKAEKKDYIFYVQEVEGTDAKIIYDTAVYKVTLKVGCSGREVKLKDGEIWTLENYSVTSETYSKGKITDGTWTADAEENAKSLSFTNTCKSTGALTIEKKVVGGGDEAKEKVYTFTVTGPDGYEEKVTITGAGSAILEGLTPGKYTVTEADANIAGFKWNPVSLSTTVTVTAGEPTSVTVTNTYTEQPETPSPSDPTGSLTIEKSIVGGGEDAAKKVFTFTVTGPSGYSKTVTITGSGKKTLSGLTPGKYTVTEGDAEIAGYELMTTGEGEVEVKANKTSTAAIENTYTEKTPTTGVLSVKKVWLGDAGANRPASVSVQILKGGAVVETVVLDDANGWSWSKTLSEEELGSTWTVSEINVPEGYTSSVSANGTSFTVTNSYGTTDTPKEPTPPTDVPDNPPPQIDWPDNPPPLVDWPPLVEVPEDPVPMVPAEPEVDIPEDPIPMVGVPQTGDISLAWYAMAILSACGLLVLMLRKREGEES